MRRRRLAADGFQRTRHGLGHDLGLARMQVARVEIEAPVLGLVVAHDDRRVAGGQRRRQRPGRGAGLGRIDPDLEPVERVVGGVGDDAGASRPGSRPRRSSHSSRWSRSQAAHRRVVALRPGLERRHRAGDALLADLHAAADAASSAGTPRAPDPCARRRCRRWVRPGTCARCRRRDRRRRRGSPADRIRTPRRRSPARRRRGRPGRTRASGIWPKPTAWWETT